jgi:hypothetical protein
MQTKIKKYFKSKTFPKMENNKHWWQCGETNPFALLMGMKNGAASVEQFHMIQ